MSLSPTHPLWAAFTILCQDNNCATPMDALEHLSWLLLLKQADTRAFKSAKDRSPPLVESPYCWSAWIGRTIGSGSLSTSPVDSVQWANGELMTFFRDKLIPHLARLRNTVDREILAAIFAPTRNAFLCQSAENLREVLALIDALESTSVSARAETADTFEALLERVGKEARLSGHFPTPTPIQRLVVEALSPQPDESVYDPACGFCTLLSAAHAFQLRVGALANASLASKYRPLLTGLEKDPVPALIGLLNLKLNGVEAPQIIRRNALYEDVNAPDRVRFDVIISNPLAGTREQATLQHNVPIPTRVTEVLWLQHCMQKLREREGARCGIVVPEGMLFREGIYSRVKERLVREFNLRYVVLLPPGTFAPYSEGKMALLFFERPGPTTEVLCYEVPSPQGKQRFGILTRITDGALSGAYEAWRWWNAASHQAGMRPEVTNDQMWIETVEQIASHRYRLAYSRPRDLLAEDRSPSVRELLDRIVQAHQTYTIHIQRLHEQALRFSEEDRQREEKTLSPPEDIFLS